VTVTAFCNNKQRMNASNEHHWLYQVELHRNRCVFQILTYLETRAHIYLDSATKQTDQISYL